MSDTIKTGLKQRINEAALNGLPMSANFANEICDLIDANTKSTVKMSNEYHTRLIEIENELFGYGRKGRLNPVSADPEQLKTKVESTQTEAVNTENFDCGDCTACKPEGLDLQSFLDAVFTPKLIPVTGVKPVNRVFMNLPTLMMVKL